VSKFSKSACGLFIYRFYHDEINARWSFVQLISFL
jgi:hypothetical protein